MALPKNADGKTKALYIWDYYKWHIIIAVLIAAVLFKSVCSYFTKERYDFEVISAQSRYYTADYASAIESVALLGEDVDSDGEKKLKLDQFCYTDIQASEYRMTMTVTLKNIIAKGESKILWLDEERLSEVVGDCKEFLVPATSYFKDAEEGALYVDISESRVLLEREIPCEGLYMAVIKDKDEESESFGNILSVAEKISEKQGDNS